MVPLGYQCVIPCLNNTCLNGGMYLCFVKTQFKPCVSFGVVLRTDPGTLYVVGNCTNPVNSTTVENSIICQCPTGYEGNLCQTRLDPCVSQPCQNGGKCCVIENHANQQP